MLTDATEVQRYSISLFIWNLPSNTHLHHSTCNKQEQVSGNDWYMRAGPSYSILSNSSVHTWYFSESLKSYVPNGNRRSFFWPSVHLQALQTAHSWAGFLGPSSLTRLPCCWATSLDPGWPPGHPWKSSEHVWKHF